MKIRAIIVEDERLPRLSLIQKLEKFHPEVEIVDSCEDADAAIESIILHKPDLLFLDIQLPGMTSIDMIDKVRQFMELPLIIFTTAYDSSEYLMKAIKLSAADYLVKPVDIASLAIALKKVEESLLLRQNKIIPTAASEVPEASGTSGASGLSGLGTAAAGPSLPGTAPAGPQTTRRPSFRTSKGFMCVPFEDIVCVKAVSNNSIMTLTTEEEPIFERLGEIWKKLETCTSFFRAGRSLIINKDFVYKLDVKANLCTLKSPSGTFHIVEVPADAFKVLKETVL